MKHSAEHPIEHSVAELAPFDISANKIHWLLVEVGLLIALTALSEERARSP